MAVTISRKNWYMRFFIWAWDVESPQTLNLCKLFWGTLFLPLFPLSFGVYKTNHTVFGFIPRFLVYWFALAMWITFSSAGQAEPLGLALGIWATVVVLWGVFLSAQIRLERGEAVEKFEEGDFIEHAKSSKPILAVSAILALPAIPLVVVGGLVAAIIVALYAIWKWRRNRKKFLLGGVGNRERPHRQSSLWAILVQVYRSFKEKTCYIIKVVE